MKEKGFIQLPILISIIGTLLVGGAYFGLDHLNKQKENETKEIISKQQKSLDEAKKQIAELQNTIKKEKETAGQPVKYVPVSQKNTAIEIEKCKSKYVVERNWDSIEDLSYIYKQATDMENEVKKEGGYIDRDKIIKAAEDHYFSKKYQGCLNAI
jgi:hypothetical protein